MQHNAQDVIPTSFGQLVIRNCHTYDGAIPQSPDGTGQRIYTHGFLTLALDNDDEATVIVNVESYDREYDGGWLGYCDDGDFGEPHEHAADAAFEVSGALLDYFSRYARA